MGATFEVDEDVPFVGRTFEEYRNLFDLSVADLQGKTILDCPGGPSAFAAVASQLGADVTAIDPKYGPPAATLAPVCEDGVEVLAEQLPEKRDQLVWTFYGDVETRLRYLRAAFERFLADYAVASERYVQSGLPDLPFDTDAFDLVLSANLLFLFDDRFGRDFHLASLRELTRVTSGEARVFPLHSLDGTRSRLVGEVSERLEAEGHEVAVRPVPYEFQPDASEMLIVTE